MVLNSKLGRVAVLASLSILAACGGGAAGDDGPRVRNDAQSISFKATPALQVGGNAAVSASATSGLAVTFASLTPQVCSVDAGSGLVTGLAVGDCGVAANQGGNDHFAPAQQATQMFAIVGKSQTVAFEPAPSLVMAGSTIVRAVASSGLAVGYGSMTPTICSVDAQTGMVTSVTMGACTIAAGQSGGGDWAPAPQVMLTMDTLPAAQTLAFEAAPSLVVGGNVNVRAKATSGLAVQYSSLSASVCSVASDTGSVTGKVIGKCTIAADQAGGNGWAAATQATLSFYVAGKAQSITFAAAPPLSTGGRATVKASASSGLAVTYSSLTPKTCSVHASSGLVTSAATGNCTLAADQPGDSTWDPAAQATLSIAMDTAAQSISFGATPSLMAGGTATVRAVASSGLAVSYSSQSPTTCSVNGSTGVVAGLAVGNCIISANQGGNASWAAAPQVTQTLTVAPNPNQTINFLAAPTLTLGGTATVRASASSGLPVAFSSLSAGICSVNSASGLVSAQALGDCVIAANQPGNTTFNPAPQVTQTLAVQVPAGATAPGAPQAVSATLGANVGAVIVTVGSVASGGSAVTGYTVISHPAGIVVQSSSAPITVNCPTNCAGYRFSVQAANAIGTGSASAAVDVLTTFDVMTRFYEPDTQPRDSIFTGSFTLNSTTGAVSGLSGQLTESMTGNAVGSAPYFDMTVVPLGFQLQSWHDASLGGTFVASFAKNTTSTFSTLGGGDGWSPQAGVANGGVYAGFPASYSGTIKNSSILIFVPDNPFAPLSAAQIAKLAYADCAPGGMMGAVCMTATSVVGYGAVGTMSGYPVSQQISKH